LCCRGARSSESYRVLRQIQEQGFQPGIQQYPRLSAPVKNLGQFRFTIAGPFALVIAVIVLAVIALVDYLSLFELDLSVLYLVPICIVAWYNGRAGAVAFSFLAVAVWLVNEDITRHVLPHSFLLFPHSFFHYWKAALLLVTWIVMAVLLDKLKIALAHADERFRTVLEGLHESVYVVDPGSGALLYLNQVCRETFACGAPLVKARDVETALQPAPLPDREHSGEFFDPVRKRWYLIHARNIVWTDARSVLLKVATDITARKQAEEVSRQQQEKLRQISHLVTVGEMASTLAHEMNQPLAAIVNYSMGCVRRLRSGSWDPKEILGAMEKAGAQAERAGRIIQRVRELVRKREPVRTPCDINSAISDVASLIEIDAEKNNVRLKLELAREMPVVRADEIMLEQAILNITRNGIESMRDTPAAERELVIRTRAGKLGEPIEIEIADTGSGIPESMQANLFEPFFTTKAQGLGMGLSICRSIVEFHDGRLSAARNPGRGSTFLLTLPAYCPWTRLPDRL